MTAAESNHDRRVRAVIYIRVAFPGKYGKDAAELQRHACERIAAKHGLTIVREYCDMGRPARLNQQTDLQRLVHDLATLQDAAHVIVWGYPVLAADMGQVNDLVSELAGYDAEVLTITGVESVNDAERRRLMDAIVDDNPGRREIQKLIDPSEENDA